MNTTAFYKIYVASIEEGHTTTVIEGIDLSSEVFSDANFKIYFDRQDRKEGELLDYESCTGIHGVVFINTNFQNAVFENLDLRGNDFTNANLEGAEFISCTLTHSLFPSKHIPSFVKCIGVPHIDGINQSAPNGIASVSDEKEQQLPLLRRFHNNVSSFIKKIALDVTSRVIVAILLFFVFQNYIPI